MANYPSPTQHQYSLQLIHRQVNNSVIEQRTVDGYINATDLCAAAGKRWHDYARNQSTERFLTRLETKTGIPVLSLIQEVRDRNGVAKTWVHPKVAIHLGQWLSEDFADLVIDWAYNYKTQVTLGNSALPPHLQRYLFNDRNVPQGYFSILQETGLSLFGPLHTIGFEIPPGWVPDISVGRCFCQWLRDELGIDPDCFPSYKHDYLDGRPPVFPKVYPENLLPAFRNWFRTVWLPTNGVKYFRGKDPSSLAYLDQLPALAAPQTPPPKRLGSSR